LITRNYKAAQLFSALIFFFLSSKSAD